MLLSIIVPVYNVEQYLLRCLESLSMQDLDESDFEVIVVNDGSTDNSLTIAENFAKEHGNVKVVTRPNGGLAAARNTGIKFAVGKYIWFVDSDDHIERNCFGTLVDQAEREDLDVLCFNLKLEFPDGRYCDYKIKTESEGIVYAGTDFVVEVDMPAAACIALYRRDFIERNRLEFYEGIFHEDQEFTPRAYCFARRISYLDMPIYYYYQREGSIMKSNRNEKRCRDLLTVAESVYDFAKKNIDSGTGAYRYLMRNVCFCFIQSLAFHTNDAMPISSYRKQPYYPMEASLFRGSMKYKILLANFSPALYSMVYKIVKHI